LFEHSAIHNIFILELVKRQSCERRGREHSAVKCVKNNRITIEKSKFALATTQCEDEKIIKKEK
jgi:hypothetical protein